MGAFWLPSLWAGTPGLLRGCLLHLESGTHSCTYRNAPGFSRHNSNGTEPDSPPHTLISTLFMVPCYTGRGWGWGGVCFLSPLPAHHSPSSVCSSSLLLGPKHDRGSVLFFKKERDRKRVNKLHSLLRPYHSWVQNPGPSPHGQKALNNEAPVPLCVCWSSRGASHICTQLAKQCTFPSLIPLVLSLGHRLRSLPGSFFLIICLVYSFSKCIRRLWYMPG